MENPSANKSLRRSQRIGRNEWIATLVVAALGVLIAVWVLGGGGLRPTNGQLGINQDRPVDYFGRVYCRPACRARFQRCEVSTGGFTFQQSRCQDSLKQCLLICDRGGAKK